MAEILTAAGKAVEATLVSSERRGIESGSTVASESWQSAIKLAFRTGVDLLEHLKLPRNLASDEAEAAFPVFVPREFAARMESGNPRDPLLLQVLGTAVETGPGSPNFNDPYALGMNDPVGDSSAEIVPGLLKKYDRRVLVVTTGACAVHCRYCFRRHFPYDLVPKGNRGLSESLKIIAELPDVDEVILSGGDPLMLSDASLHAFIEQLNDLPKIQRLRLHSRVPVIIPQRVCDEMLAWIRESRAAVYLVTHFNHPNEIDSSVRDAMDRLRRSGVSLLNQSVLLAGVNDSIETMVDLCLKLANMQVLPYYLHQLDRVSGGMHFAISDSQARVIAAGLRSALPGYAVPRLVREIAGEPSKTPL